jgi:hypothetical protein
VGRFDPHTRLQPNEPVEIAVDTRALHFFDIDSGLGIYESKQKQGRPVIEQRHEIAA